MADIAKLTMPSGTQYDIKDAEARRDIEELKGSVTGAMHYVGVTSTALTDGSPASSITVGSKTVTAKAGDVAIYGDKEFVYSDTDNKWHEYGDTGSLKALAFKDAANGNFTPHGTVSQPTFTGTAMTSTGTYTPSGNVSTTVTLNDTTVNSITDVGTLPTCTFPVFSATVQNENLTLSWTEGIFTQGTLPTKGADTTVATTVNSATSTFTGTEGNLSVSGTPSGTVSTPTFTGTEETVTVS